MRYADYNIMTYSHLYYAYFGIYFGLLLLNSSNFLKLCANYGIITTTTTCITTILYTIHM